jgi:N-acetyl-anhydromuramyl-L-alanine amidase AmpD
MFVVRDGKIIDDRVVTRIEPLIEKGAMATVHGIVVHQTGGPTAESAFNSYKAGNSGAHLLIDRDGTVYQTARLNQKTWHVGKLRARCVVELKCPAPKKWDPSGTNKTEMAKAWPDRYPSNEDAIGIELVAGFNSKTGYDIASKEQNASLSWLVAELQASLGLNAIEVFRHPQVSYKQDTEAATANWTR